MHYVVTLVEESYLIGAVTLYNSLIRNGFAGKYIIGYRNYNKLPIRSKQSIEGCDKSEIELIEVDTKLHFTNYKPQFMKRILAEYSDIEKITYLDPDIVLASPFEWIDKWCEGGPLASSDVNYWFPAEHPLRNHWMESLDLKCKHPLQYYINGGQLSIKKEHSDFLNLWENIMNKFQEITTDERLYAKGDIKNSRGSGRWDAFMAPDQDALNIALMSWPNKISILGPDVMGFTGMGMLPHAIGSHKPWKVCYVLRVFNGYGPRYVDKIFWKYANNPLQSYRKLFLIFKRLDLLLSGFLSRFYSKNKHLR